MGSRFEPGPEHHMTPLFNRNLRPQLVAGDSYPAEYAQHMLRAFGMERVITIMHQPLSTNTQQAIRAHGMSYTWIDSTDNSAVEPKVILDSFDSYLPREGPLEMLRTYVHCHLGQNRSCALAACYLLLWTKHHSMDEVPLDWWGESHLEHADLAIEYVEQLRTTDLAILGRGRAQVSPAMRENVRKFAFFILDNK